MFLIKWRRRMETTRYRTIEPTITGLSRYVSQVLAQQQVDRFQKAFPFNSYFIEPA
jgi:hypothetical protein